MRKAENDNSIMASCGHLQNIPGGGWSKIESISCLRVAGMLELQVLFDIQNAALRAARPDQSFFISKDHMEPDGNLETHWSCNALYHVLSKKETGEPGKDAHVLVMEKPNIFSCTLGLAERQRSAVLHSCKMHIMGTQFGSRKGESGRKTRKTRIRGMQILTADVNCSKLYIFSSAMYKVSTYDLFGILHI